MVKQLIAHRGASGYAPEHTAAAYRLAIEQHADFLEPDLAVTKDNVLVCLHDDTLERTTNVAEVFPDWPSSNVPPDKPGGPIGKPGKRWLVNDFRLVEIRQLDAGAWFKPEFAGERVQSFQDAIDLVRGRVGLFAELKSPELYRSRDVDQVKLFVAILKQNGLDTPESLAHTPVIVESFDEATVRRLATELPTVPRVFLTSDDRDVTQARLRQLAGFITGVAPEKTLIARRPELVKAAHALGLTVTAWAFSADEKTSFRSVREEMAHYLYTLGIDALFTDNPDQFPREVITSSPP